MLEGPYTSGLVFETRCTRQEKTSFSISTIVVWSSYQQVYLTTKTVVQSLINNTNLENDYCYKTFTTTFFFYKSRCCFWVLHNVLVKVNHRVAHTQTTFDPLSDMRIRRRLDRPRFFEVSDNGQKRLSDAVFLVVISQELHLRWRFVLHLQNATCIVFYLCAI